MGLEHIEHIVVVMMENRSFDNLLAYLPHTDPSFRRPPAGWSNPRGPASLMPPIEFRTTSEDVNGDGPGHYHTSALRQLTGPWTPLEWDNFGAQPWTALGLRWDELAANGCTGRGYYWDYATDKLGQRPFKRVMRGWERPDIPALHALALEYGICQQWFCPVPGQTQPNRHFAMSGTSFGRVDNGKPIYFSPRGESIFGRLESKDISWGFYGDFSSLTPLICPDSRFRNRSRRRFYREARAGELPTFSFVEPNELPVSQSQHPGGSEGPKCLWRGDALIARVYNALRSNWESWRKTLLIITWDEHGGFPDHETPPRKAEFATGSETNDKSDGFDFTLLGPRVPAVIASPWVKPGLLDDVVRDHTSILATVRKRFPQLGEPFGRDAVMPDLSAVLSGQIHGDESRLPSVEERVESPRFLPLVEEEADERLDPLQIDIAQAMFDVAAAEGVDLGIDKPADELTVAEAIELARKIAETVGAEGDEFTVE